MDYATLVEQAVGQFYSAGNNEAHSWLLQVQASPEAWNFSWQLLDPSKVITVVSYLIFLPLICLLIIWELHVIKVLAVKVNRLFCYSLHML